MEQRAEAEQFPTVGPEVGQFLQFLVHLTGARKIFECGSGFGYSAYWMGTALPAEGEIVLTEIDADELAAARTYLDQSEISANIRYEHGDALEILVAEDEDYDIILLDHENERYREGFEIAKKNIGQNGTIIADNILHSAEFSPGDVAACLIDGEINHGQNPSLQGILEFLHHIRVDSTVNSVVVPVGEGIVLSHPRDRTRDVEQ